MQSLEQIDIASWDRIPSEEEIHRATMSLENGKVLFFPALPFLLSEEENVLLNPEKVDPKRKNISYDIKNDHLGGSLFGENEERLAKAMIKRFAVSSRKLIDQLIPHYKETLIQARTSFRPVEIHGRKQTVLKDDTRLHVDAFPSTPTKGSRILRFFSNINHEGKSRVWRTGEPFDAVVDKYAKKVSKPFPGFASLLKMLKITKGYRTPYDHYMLHMHNKMKEDNHYQSTVAYDEIYFPPGSSWMVYTDQVSHAALSGQHVLEQTFYMPVLGLKNESTAPLRVLEKHFKRPLI